MASIPAWQTLATTLLVVACSLYSAWRLMPAGLQRRLRLALGVPVASTASGGCGSGCGGCGGAPSNSPTSARKSAPAGEQAIHIVRRPPGA